MLRSRIIFTHFNRKMLNDSDPVKNAFCFDDDLVSVSLNFYPNTINIVVIHNDSYFARLVVGAPRTRVDQ